MSRKRTADSRIRINRDTLNCESGSRHRTWLKCYAWRTNACGCRKDKDGKKLLFPHAYCRAKCGKSETPHCGKYYEIEDCCYEIEKAKLKALAICHGEAGIKGGKARTAKGLAKFLKWLFGNYDDEDENEDGQDETKIHNTWQLNDSSGCCDN